MERVGVLGGTFDPPHWAHLWLAETAREQLKLDKVLFVPAGQPPHKQHQVVTAVPHRLTMIRQAIAGIPYFACDLTDIEREPPHRTATLLPLLAQVYPNKQWWLLLGADSLRDLPLWATPQEIIRHCRLAVLPRPGVMVDMAALETAVAGVTHAVDWLDGPTMHISSTQVRQWAQSGHSLQFLMPSTTAAYIQAHRLYG